ncbi:MAG: hypothetical protein J2P38_03165 [Candidatus Dormibacteraeota bacterium]|nr:hypothetical protein [Candidatus Dormibacteraeota bacterium]
MRRPYRVRGLHRARRSLPYAVVALSAAVTIAAGLLGIAAAAQPASLTQRYVTATPRSTPTAPQAAPSSVPAPSGQTARMAALAAPLPPDSVSVAARNLTTGASFSFGSSGGQTTASVVKLDILETLLLEVQAVGQHLTDDQNREARNMIEDSDDDAASQLWSDVGGGPAIAAANRRLGVQCTVPDPGSEWGLTTTCAQGQVQLLYQLESRSSPLEEARRDYVLSLLTSVSPDQAWGIPVVADSDTQFAVKDGWLNLDGDTDWAINSDAIVTYHGQTLLIAVLTQNDETEYSGVRLVEQLAPLAAQSVAR